MNGYHHYVYGACRQRAVRYLSLGRLSSIKEEGGIKGQFGGYTEDQEGIRRGGGYMAKMNSFFLTVVVS